MGTYQKFYCKNRNQTWVREYPSSDCKGKPIRVLQSGFCYKSFRGRDPAYADPVLSDIAREYPAWPRRKYSCEFEDEDDDEWNGELRDSSTNRTGANGNNGTDIAIVMIVLSIICIVGVFSGYSLHK